MRESAGSARPSTGHPRRSLTPASPVRHARRLAIAYFALTAGMLCVLALAVILASGMTRRIVEAEHAADLADSQAILVRHIADLVSLPGDRTVSAPHGLRNIVDSFERAHRQLGRHATLTPGLHRHFFTAEDGETLEFAGRRLVTDARTRLRGGGPAPDRLAAATNGQFTAKLEQLANAFRDEAAQTSQRRQTLAHVTPLAIGLMLMCQTFMVFRPGHRLLRSTFRALSDARADLAETSSTLYARDDDLRHRNILIESKRARLERALRQSERLRREQAEFTYAVSHDLKSPANSIQLLLSEIMHEPDTLPEDVREMLTMALTSVQQMHDLIEDVLAYSWATGDRERPVAIDMRACIEAAVDSQNTTITRTGATVTIGPCCVHTGFPSQLGRLVHDLLGNALKFQPASGKPVIGIRCQPGAEPQTVVLTVEDNGIGIEPEDQRRIFGLFQRLHLRESFPGSGLGLAICDRIAHNHGGFITVQSTPGTGSTFTVHLGPPQSAILPDAA
ncbi:sensor histidine kinase [Algicella marina]|uniref:histidine kinase n=1 Tax=Algicella marina TaxID=2683284 RepID=A0A6P1SYP6_9RHOB|nr:HAMP domain-containing sensor histidine kinase [Algicella marina]QHQ34336.1 hypothetical protein GO499_03610 [Algicella marina]